MSKPAARAATENGEDSMFKLWRWVFARECIRQERWWPRDSRLAAVFSVSLAIYMNLLAVVFAVGLVVGVDPTFGINKFAVAGAGLVLLFLVYRRYVMQGAADDMIRQMKRQNKRKTRREERKLWLYIVGSLALPMLTVVIGTYLRSKLGDAR